MQVVQFWGPSGVNDLNKKEKIIDAATRLFNSKGYHDTRLQDIGEKLGVVKTTLIYHFKNKETILYEAYRRSCENYSQLLNIASQQETGLNRALEFLRQQLEWQARSLSGEHPQLALITDLDALSEDKFGDVAKDFQNIVERFSGFLAEGESDGSVEVESRHASTFFVFNVLYGTPSWLKSLPASSIPEATKSFLDIIKYGLSFEYERPKTVLNRPAAFERVPDIIDRDTINRMKRNAFLRTGIRFLNLYGYRNLSLDNIASELGVTRGAFYYQIEDKEEFLVRTFERTCELFESALTFEKESERKASGLVKIETMTKLLFEGHVTELEPLLNLNLAHLLTNPHQAILNARLKRIRALLAEYIAHGMLDGSLRDVDAEISENIIIYAFFAEYLQSYAAISSQNVWQPGNQSANASSTYCQSLINGLASKTERERSLKN